ncbi:hypothetical protein EJV46_15730 [Roseococcus sp. SYP-B2431]|nr:hypothetical protein EJV46_15730 [Roseococcus sp. SYP-B2431]
MEAGTLPVRELATIAVREGQRPRPVYGAHKWFARRLGSAFRALLLASTLPPNGDFWAAYETGVSLEGITLLDPFVGGGTSCVEGQRLGARCLGTDVDPVAVAVSRFQGRMHALGDLVQPLARLSAEVGAEVERFHKRPDNRLILHHFWVQVVECRGCGLLYDAQPHHVLAAEVGKPERHVFCGQCDQVHLRPVGEEVLACDACGASTEIAKGAVVFGTATCPHCGLVERLIDLSERTGVPPRFRLFATESIPPNRSGRAVPMTERQFQKADEHDFRLLDAAAAMLKTLLADGGPGLPDRIIPNEGRADDRLIRYGYRRYIELFNDRQRLHLLLLARAITALPEGLEREALAIAFSDHLKSLNMMAGYAFGYRRISPLFALRAFRHIPRPVELNPWVPGTGRGGFPNAVRSVQRAARWALSPVEYNPAGGFFPPRQEKKGEVDVRHVPASHLAHVPDGSVDLLLTDPPYFDNIAYSELADFFLPWQRMLGLVDSPEVPGLPPDQLAAPGRSDAEGDVFREKLGACFAEVSRKMKDGALGVFTYQHRTAVGWERLASALASSPLRVVNVFPLAGDVGTSLHKHDESISWDAVLVVRKDVALKRRSKPANVDVIAAAGMVERWSRVLDDLTSPRFRKADQDNLWRAALVASSLSNGSGPIALSDALKLPWDASLGIAGETGPEKLQAAALATSPAS